MGSKFGGYQKRLRQIERSQRIRDKRTAKAALKLARRELKRGGQHNSTELENVSGP
jgi:hypothetical protein